MEWVVVVFGEQVFAGALATLEPVSLRASKPVVVFALGFLAVSRGFRAKGLGNILHRDKYIPSFPTSAQ